MSATARAGLLAPLTMVLSLGACGGDDSEAAELGSETGTATGTEGGGSTGTTGEGETGTGETGTDTETDTDTDTDTDSGTTGETGEPGPAGIFVAVGDGGRRASSIDAIDWDEIVGSGVIDTGAEMGEEDILRAIAVGDGVAVAVGGGGADWNGNSMIMRSVDGTSWDEDVLAATPEIADRKLMAVGFADGVFIAGGRQTHILRSDDGGLSWTRPYPEHVGDTSVFDVAGAGGAFVLVGMHKDGYDTPEVAYVQRSSDAGLSFDEPTFFGVDGEFLTAVATNGEVYVATGPQVCLRSVDAGASWDDCGLGAPSYGEVHFARERFIVTYLDGLSTSNDGADWSPHVESSNGVPPKVVFGNGVYAGVRYYDRGLSETLDVWTYSTHGGFPLRDLAFLALE